MAIYFAIRGKPPQYLVFILYLTSTLADSLAGAQGLKKIMLHASLYDTTLMRERLSYSLFRSQGLAAPRSTHIDVRLHTNDSAIDLPLGLHLLTEQVDGRFTKTWLKGGDNTLWKEAWPGLRRNEYEYLLETNEGTADATRGVQRFVNFSASLAAASTDWELVQVVRRFMKARTVSTYWAVDRAIEHWDGPVNFRGGGGQSGCSRYWSESGNNL